MNFLSVNKCILVVCGFWFLITQIPLVGGQQVTFQDQERAYIHTLANEIEDIFEFFKINVSKFIDPCDHTSYRQLALALNNKIGEFENKVMVVLSKKLVEARENNAETLRESLAIVHEILTDFLARLNLLRAILMRPEYLNARDGLQAIKLGKELEKYCKDLLDGKIISQLEAKIDKVYKIVSLANECTLADRLKELKNILKSLIGASMQKKSGSELKIVNGIAAKIRHNK